MHLAYHKYLLVIHTKVLLCWQQRNICVKSNMESEQSLTNGLASPRVIPGGRGVTNERAFVKI